MELNQLELQFLLLNDFRLVIPLDELQRYADQLILFWIGRDGSQQHPRDKSLMSSSVVNRSSSISRPAMTTSTSSMALPLSSHHINDASDPVIPAPATPTVSTSTSTSYHKTPPAPSSQVTQRSNHTRSASHSRSRPQSLRSAPSSSGTSVTSTVTPTTPRGGSEADDDNIGSDDGEREGERGRTNYYNGADASERD